VIQTVGRILGEKGEIMSNNKDLAFQFLEENSGNEKIGSEAQYGIIKFALWLDEQKPPTQDAPDPETGAAKSDDEYNSAVSGG
jgi:hypothetical protein